MLQARVSPLWRSYCSHGKCHSKVLSATSILFRGSTVTGWMNNTHELQFPQFFISTIQMCWQNIAQVKSVEMYTLPTSAHCKSELKPVSFSSQKNKPVSLVAKYGLRENILSSTCIVIRNGSVEKLGVDLNTRPFCTVSTPPLFDHHFLYQVESLALVLPNNLRHKLWKSVRVVACQKHTG